jgi:hypothetical protein
MGVVMSIKSVLREELGNSIRMQERYEQELAKLPRGSLVKRKIRGHEYCYLVFREAGKVRSVYQGKPDLKELARYRDVKSQRAQYRKLLSKAKRQVRFLRGVLRGKEPI